MEDRRRAVRVAVDGNLVTLPSAFDVDVLDINVEGVLLRANQSLDIGTRRHLRLNMWGAAFDAEVEVRRVSPAAHDGTSQVYDIGAVFMAISPEHRQLIERFAIQ
jgi:PilZ domain